MFGRSLKRVKVFRRAPDKKLGSEPPQILAPTADLGPFLNSVSTTSSAFLDSRATRERSAPSDKSAPQKAMVGKGANVSLILIDTGRAGFEIGLLDHGHLLHFCPCPLLSRDAFEHVEDLFAQPRTNLGSVVFPNYVVDYVPPYRGTEEFESRRYITHT